MEQEEKNRQHIRSYLEALGRGVIGDELSRFFTSDVIQIEYPNRLNPNGGRSDLATILLRAGQGQKLMTEQTFEIQSEVVEGARVAVETIWTGTLAVSMGTLKAGSKMKAYFAICFVLRDGLIAVQRNYDCFEPW